VRDQTLGYFDIPAFRRSAAPINPRILLILSHFGVVVK
jgi:hypothetical protein